jgi:hypothetical protein
MRRIVLAAVAAFLFAAPPALAVDNTFTAAVNSNWNTAGNWSLNHVPDGTEDAKLNAAADLSLGANGAARSIAVNSGTGLTVGGGVNLTVGTGASSIAAGVTLRDGSVLTLGGATAWAGGSIAFGGSAVASLENKGVLTVTGASPTAFHSICCSAGLVKNDVGATINRSSGTGPLALNVPIDNDGTLTVGSGTVSTAFPSSATSKGTFTIASGAELSIGADLPLESGASISGLGTLRAGGGVLTVPAGATVGAHDLIVQSSELKLDGSATIPGTLALTAGGTRSGSGTLTVNGGSTLSGGALDGAGTTNLDGATTTEINGNGVRLGSGHVLHLHAPAHWSAGVIAFGGSAVPSLEVDGGMTIDGDLTAQHQICCSQGRFHVPSGATVTRASGTGDLAMDVPFDNDGTLALNTGKFAVGFGETGSTGAFNLASGTEFRTVAGTYGLASGASMSGAGTVRVGGGVFSVASGATLAPTDLRDDSGQLDLATDVTAGTLTMAGGSRTGAGKLTVNGATTISGGSFGGAATTELKGTTDLSGPFELINGHTLKLGPTTTWSAGQISFGGSPDAVLLNPGTLTVAGDRTADNTTCCSAGIIRNTGTFNRTTSSGTLTLDVHVENSGTFNLQTGTLSDPTFAYTQTAGTTVLSNGTTLATDTRIQGGSLRGNATIAGPLTNSGGVVQPGSSPGTLTVTGDYTQGAGGTLEEEITGAAPGTFDRLLVGGAATLDGTLAIQSPGFTPASTDTFKIISGATSRSGTFAQVTGGGTNYTPQYDSDGVTLGATPTPPPGNSIAPSIPTSATEGDSVECTPGTWTGSPTFAFQWLRDGSPTGVATATYATGAADVGHTLVCRVTASNAGGNTDADSGGLVPSAAPPGNTPAPPIPVEPPPTPPAPSPEPVVVSGLPPAEGCVPGGLTLHIGIRAAGLRNVDVLLDGKRFTTSKKAHFKLVVPGSRITPGRHKLRIIGHYKTGKTNKIFSFARCRGGGRSPRIKVGGAPSRTVCRDRAFTFHAVVTGAVTKSIRLTLDGASLGRPNKADFRRTIDVPSLGAGKHRVLVLAADRFNNSSRYAIDFVRCP